MAERYTEVERSQHLTQSDPRIFGTSYVARTSAVDGQSAFLGETRDHSVNKFFQGLKVFREEGLPTSLPKAMRANLERDPAEVALEESKAAARSPREALAAERARQNLIKSLEHKALNSFRKEYIKKRRDWKILTRGKVASAVDTDVSRMQRAKKLGLPPSSLEYCYDCTECYVRGRELDEHCQMHLSPLPKNCGSIPYCHALVKPAYCVFHLAATNLPATQRMQSWSRDADALAHIKDEHLSEVGWPLACPLGCEGESKDEESFFYHLSDRHGYSLPSSSHKRKREDGHVVQAKKRKVDMECTTDDEFPPLQGLPAKTERGTDPALPTVIDSDDPVKPPPDVKPPQPQPFADPYLSPKVEDPLFCRAESMCSTIDDELERPCENSLDSMDPDPFDEFCISDWVNPPPSPPPDSGLKRLDLEAAGSACSVPAAGVKLLPSPAPSARSERREPHVSLNSTPETDERSASNTNEGGSDSASSDREKSKKLCIWLNYNYKRPRIVLRLGRLPPAVAKQDGQQVDQARDAGKHCLNHVGSI